MLLGDLNAKVGIKDITAHLISLPLTWVSVDI